MVATVNCARAGVQDENLADKNAGMEKEDEREQKYAPSESLGHDGLCCWRSGGGADETRTGREKFGVRLGA